MDQIKGNGRKRRYDRTERAGHFGQGDQAGKRNRKVFGILVALFLSAALLIGGCSVALSGMANAAGNARQSTENNRDTYANTQFDLSSVPAYSGESSVAVHDNVPFFTQAQLEQKDSYETYGKLDRLGRCTGAIACIGTDLMPVEKRGSIGEVRPTGWHTVKYDGIDGNYLYNRCHLIGYQLTAENANERNLITGTRYMNTEGMLPYENQVADYIKETGNHVLYRVTPVFEGNNLLASGVLMEAESVEDQGGDICFCVYCYNVQPGITINYADGSSSGSAFSGSENAQQADTKQITYVLNTNTMKFHKPSCPSVKKISDQNRQDYYGTRNELLSEGYTPCGNCKP